MPEQAQFVMEKTAKHFAKKYGVKLPAKPGADASPKHHKTKGYTTQYVSSSKPKAEKLKADDKYTKYGYKTSGPVVEAEESEPPTDPEEVPNDAPDDSPQEVSWGPQSGHASVTTANGTFVTTTNGISISPNTDEQVEEVEEVPWAEGPDTDEAQAVDHAISDLEAVENEIMEEAEEYDEPEELVNPFKNEEGN
jgi:hypothetical protein